MDHQLQTDWLKPVDRLHLQAWAGGIARHPCPDFACPDRVRKERHQPLIRYFTGNSDKKSSAWMTHTDRYHRSRSFITGRQLMGGMVSRVFYRAGLLELLTVFARRIQVFENHILFISPVIYGMLLMIVLIGISGMRRHV